MKPSVQVAIPELWGDKFIAMIPIDAMESEEAQQAAQLWIDKLIKLTPKPQPTKAFVPHRRTSRATLRRTLR